MRRVNIFIFLTFSFSMMYYPLYSLSEQSFQMSTWSIAAIDLTTGDIGVATASCVPLTYIDCVAALVPGKGVAAIQAWWELKNRNTVYQLLQEGKSAEEIIQHVSDPAYDANMATRQYGVITLKNGTISAAAFTGNGTSPWAGSMQDIKMGVTIQGNILVSEDVVADAMQAFKKNDEQGYNALPDRLIRALEAGSAAGGDRRCNNDQINQTAASAFILVARSEDKPYAASTWAITDMGTPNAPWLDISVIESQFGDNPIIELRERYDGWRKNTVLVESQAKLATTWGSIKQ